MTTGFNIERSVSEDSGEVENLSESLVNLGERRSRWK